ncbi:MAG: YaeQ family protein [Verrucomicrobiales bacterium]
MSAKFNFGLRSEDPARKLPSKIIIGRQETETLIHVGLKLMGYVLFYRERLQIETRLPNLMISFIPDLVQLDYELRPQLWVECGECSVPKLDKLAVKAPEAELWVVKKSVPEAEELIRGMAKEGLRKNRYGIVALDGEMFEEMCNLMRGRNEMLWVSGGLEQREAQFDFNGLWFEMPITVFQF